MEDRIRKEKVDKKITSFYEISNSFSFDLLYSSKSSGFAVNHYKVTRQTVDIDFLCTKGLKKLRKEMYE